MQVFLSYAHTPADSALVTYIDASLRAAGFTVWRDQSNLPAGQLLQDAIEKAIANALARGLRIADILQPNMRKIGTAQMGSAIVEEVEKLMAG